MQFAHFSTEFVIVSIGVVVHMRLSESWIPLNFLNSESPVTEWHDLRHLTEQTSFIHHDLFYRFA